MFNTCVISPWVKLTSTGRVCNSLCSCGVATLVQQKYMLCATYQGVQQHKNVTHGTSQGVRQHKIIFWIGIKKCLLDEHQKLSFGRASKKSFGWSSKNILLMGPNSMISHTCDLPKCRSSFQQKNQRTDRWEPPVMTYWLQTDDGWWDDGQMVQI